MLQIHNLVLHYGVRPILDEISFDLDENECIGLIGINGCGKSSLLKVINGDVEIDFGKIYTKGPTSVAYLSQDPITDIIKWSKKPILSWYLKKQEIGAGNINEKIDTFDESFDIASILKIEINNKIKIVKTVQDIIDLQKNFLISQYKHFGYTDKELLTIENKFVININSLKKSLALNIDFENSDFRKLSGGQLRKIGLILVLSLDSHVLLLDEPTNHLDLESILSLEKIIKSSKKKSIIFVSHDRYFTDNVAKVMWEIENTKLITHKGNYTKFLKDKTENSKNLKTEIWKKSQYLKRELEWVKSGVKARGTKNKGRVDQFNQDKRYLETIKSKGKSKLNVIISKPLRLGSKIVEVSNNSLSVGDNLLWKDFSVAIQPNDKIGILGPNGSGKTTLLKLLTDKIDIDIIKYSGKVNIGINSKFLYYSQHKEIEDLNQTPFTFIGEGREMIKYHDGESIKEISTRHYLKLWLFDKSKYTTPIINLSGGEKSRLVLAKLLLSPANILILDEPTNDLDLDTMMVLEQALIDYEGVVIIISHDRTFINRVCNQIWFFDNQKIHTIHGNYDTVKHRFEKTSDTIISDKNETIKDNISPTISNKITKKIAKDILNIENLISLQEKLVFDLQSKFNNPELFSDRERVAKIKTHLEREERKLEEMYKEWEDMIKGKNDISQIEGK